MRRSPPGTLSEINHPGPRSGDRRPFASCSATPVTLDLDARQPVLERLGTWAEKAGFSSAVLDLAGLSLAPFDYVMPDRAVDDRHVAWYSDTKSSGGAVLEEAVAILGRRDGTWFAHIHACWREQGVLRLGHILPDSLVTAEPSTVSGFGLKKARFEARDDPETEFKLFRVEEAPAHGAPSADNALIATLAPFEDLHSSLADLARTLRATTFSVHGLGSLAGAEFLDGEPMTGLISEILIRPGSGKLPNAELRVDVRCVDLHGALFQGEIRPGKAPTLVTCEVLVLKIG